jgi:hypothetical protein
MNPDPFLLCIALLILDEVTTKKTWATCVLMVIGWALILVETAAMLMDVAAKHMK